MENIYSEQLNLIFELFDFAKTNNLFLLISGGWNIDLRFEQKIRDHDDLDFHFELKELDNWIEFFLSKGFTMGKKDNWYYVFENQKGIILDFEAVSIDEDVLTWRYGNKSSLSEVVENFEFERKKLLGMKLNVELYKKEMKQREGWTLRPKDLVDVLFLKKKLN